MSILRRLREDRKLSLRDLSTKTGIDYSTISKIERGERGFNEQNLSIFSDFFNVSTDHLLGRVDKTQVRIVESLPLASQFKNTKEFKDVIYIVDTLSRDELIAAKGLLNGYFGFRTERRNDEYEEKSGTRKSS